MVVMQVEYDLMNGEGKVVRTEKTQPFAVYEVELFPELVELVEAKGFKGNGHEPAP